MAADASSRSLGLPRGSVVVCVAVQAVDGETLAGVHELLAHTDPSLAVVLVGAADSLGEAWGEVSAACAGRTVLQVTSSGRDASSLFGAAMEATDPADVAWVSRGIAVAAGWLEGLRDAATADSTFASATPLSIGCGGLELSMGDDPGGFPVAPGGAAGEDAGRRGAGHREAAGISRSTGEAVERLAPRVAARALRLYPRIATMGPGCVYIRRAAWELTGAPRSDLPLEGAFAELAARIVAAGMVNVLADDVLVLGGRSAQGGASRGDPADGRERGGGGDSSSARGREPGGGASACPQATIACDERGPLRRCLDRARVALGGLSVTIDARSVTAAVGGTQTYVVGLVRALAREGSTRVRVVLAPDAPAWAIEQLACAPTVELISYEEALADVPLTDVVHRPQQVFTAEDLALLRLLGRRIVIGQQDLIAYRNPAYHRDLDAWRAYRRTTRLSLAAADQVVFFSEHARRDALAEDLLPRERAHVAGIGAEPIAAAAPDGPAAPRAVAPERAGADGAPSELAADEAFLLCIGADYAHKNRPFAIELLAALRELGWEGKLVFAGAHVPYGSSREREQELLALDRGVAERVVDLGGVEESRKRWLYAHARALLYPTLYEGFGLIPLEAAAMGLPCLFAAQASLREVAPEAATLIPWDAPASARAVLPLLHEGTARDRHVGELQSVARPAWEDVARDLLAVYDEALAAPPSAAAPRAWQELDRERYIADLGKDVTHLKAVAQEYQDLYHSLDDRVRFGLALIDRGGLLSVDQQRALMRIASRGRVGTVLLAPLGLLGRGGRGDGGGEVQDR